MLLEVCDSLVVVCCLLNKCYCLLAFFFGGGSAGCPELCVVRCALCVVLSVRCFFLQVFVILFVALGLLCVVC